MNRSAIILDLNLQHFFSMINIIIIKINSISLNINIMKIEA